MGLDTSFPTGELGAEESEEVREKDDGRDALDAFEPRLGLEESKCVPLASLVRLYGLLIFAICALRWLSCERRASSKARSGSLLRALFRFSSCMCV